MTSTHHKDTVWSSNWCMSVDKILGECIDDNDDDDDDYDDDDDDDDDDNEYDAS